MQTHTHMVMAWLSLLLLQPLSLVAQDLPVLDPLDFATEVVGYVPGEGIGTDWMSGKRFDDPTVALGRPTVDTTGNGWEIHPDESVPVVPVSPAFRASELVTVGSGGSLILAFDRPVFDHPNHPFGVDFILFGNAMQAAAQSWSNRSPHVVTLLNTAFSEPGWVSVSQDGEVWFSYTNGPFADTFAPTLGRVFDPEAPDTSLGEWNEWWGAPTDPTRPLDPAITAPDLAGRTVAEVAQIYGRSAGGTGFDLSELDLPVDPETGLKWMQYVRIEAPTTPGITPEIDAVAAVRPVSDYELWRLAQFDWEQRVEPDISGDEATSLVPGVPNRLVYAMGLDVENRPLRLVVDAGELRVSYPRRIGQEALALQIEWSADLLTWGPAGIGAVIAVEPQGDGTELVTHRVVSEFASGAVRVRGVRP